MNKKVLPLLTAAALSITLAACGNSNDSTENKEKPAASAAANGDGSAKQSQGKKDSKLPEYKGQSLHEAIVDLRDRKVKYEVGGNNFDQKKENKNTRNWTVTKQEIKDGGKRVVLFVEKKS